jgi:hypothetical protein
MSSTFSKGPLATNTIFYNTYQVWVQLQKNSHTLKNSFYLTFFDTFHCIFFMNNFI